MRWHTINAWTREGVVADMGFRKVEGDGRREFGSARVG